MIDGTRAEDMPPSSPGRPSRWRAIWQRLSVRLLLVLGIVVFFAAVGVDSLQQAAAADMVDSAIAAASDPAINGSPLSASARPEASMDVAGTYLEFNAATAQRLQRSDLLGPQLTRSRLTSAHLFPSLSR